MLEKLFIIIITEIPLLMTEVIYLSISRLLQCITHTVLDHRDHIKARIWQDDMLVRVVKIIEGSMSAE